MGIMDIFRTGGNRGDAGIVNNQRHGTQTPEPPMTQRQPGADPNQMAQQPSGTSANGQPQATDPPKSPLDQFKDLWQTPVNKDGQQPVDPLSQPLLQTDPTKLAAAAKQMNFAQGVDPALVQKALGGDQQAFIDVINGVAQNAFLASSQLGTSVAEGAIKTNNTRLAGTLEGKFKEYVTMQLEKPKDNPVLNHPAAAPMLDMAKRALLQKHPDKSPAEINQMATQFMTDFASQLTGQQTTSQQGGQQQRDPTDFSNWV